MDERRNELLGVAEAAAATITPGMIDRMAQLAERSATALDLATSPEILELLTQMRSSAPALTRALRAVAEAGDEAAQSNQQIGLLDLVRAMKRPEVQFALRFTLALASRTPTLKGD